MKSHILLLAIACLIFGNMDNAKAQQVMMANNRTVVNKKPAGKVVNVAAIEPIVNKMKGFYQGKMKHTMSGGAEFKGNGSINIKKLSATRIRVSFKSNLVGVPNFEAEKEIENDMGMVNITYSQNGKTYTLHIQLATYTTNNGQKIDAITGHGTYSYDGHRGSFEFDDAVPKDAIITF